jgi:hypothetical protein
LYAIVSPWLLSDCGLLWVTVFFDEEMVITEIITVHQGLRPFKLDVFVER